MGSLIALLTSTFLCSYVLGAMQYFVMEALTGLYGMENRAWIVQAVAATVTVGPALIYFFSGALVSAMRKAFVMALSMVGVLALLGGIYFSLKLGNTLGLWFSLTFIGILFGLYSAGKMSAIPFVQGNLKMSMTAVNGLMSMVFIFGLMPGAFCGTLFYNNFQGSWHYILGAISIVTIVVSLFCLPKGETRIPYVEAQKNLFKGTLKVFGKHWTLLLTGAALWGSANAVQMALNAYLTMHNYASTQVAATIPVAAAIGAVIGTLVSPLFNKVRFVFITLFTLLMGVCVFSIPFVCHSTFSVMTFTVVMGSFFGLAVNLNDSTFLEIARQENVVGVGASLQSALLALLSALVSTLAFFLLQIFKVITPDQSFTLFALCCLIILFMSFLVGFKYGKREMNPAVAMMVLAARQLLKLRYKITVNGAENLKKSRGMLILPNHPAEMDPVMELLTFWNVAHPRVVLIEDFYEMPALKWLFLRLDAISIPDIEGTAGVWKKHRVEKALDDVVEALKAGDNVLLYPGGALWRQGREVVGAKSGLHYILSRVPNAPVALAHASGLWGSSFSYVYENRRPRLFAQLWHGIKVVLKNGIFFVPKRPVKIDVIMAGEDFPRHCKDKMELNAWLENWHGKYGEEPLTLYPYSIWSKELPKLAKVEEKPKVDESKLNTKILSEVTKEIARQKNRNPSEIMPSDRLTDDLGMDSLEVAEVLSWLQDTYGVADVSPRELINVAAVAHIAASTTNQIAPEDVAPPPPLWNEIEGRKFGNVAESRTLAEAFLRTCDRGGKQPFLADEALGVLTFEQFKMAVVVFATLIKEMPGKRIGIMLPALSICDILLFATQLAGKQAVMLNWTLGEANLRHVVEIAELDVVLTAEAFVDQLDSLPLDLFLDKLVTVEELKKQIGLSHKLKAWRQKNWKTEKMLKAWGLDKVSEDDLAIILFTSGSENVPKGVPLTHKNLLSNVAGLIEALDLSYKDILYSFLPPFHSFGLTMTTLMPAVTGIRNALYPNPTAYRALAIGFKKWGVTIAGGTATFIKGIIRAGKPELFAALRLVGCGGEKTPPELFDLFRARIPHTKLIEGYGITECSPLLCLTRVDDEIVGVGKPVRGVEVKVVGIDNYEELPSETQGLIIARGVSVFNGYLGGKPNPFIKLSDGSTWYNTGDLGYFTAQGNLIITGRLKRFVKIGGEMISLPALEAVLNHRWPSSDDRQLMAVEAREIEGERPELILFSVLDKVTIDDANNALREAGIANVARLSAIKYIPEMPLLGTGKTDYRSLKISLNQK